MDEKQEQAAREQAEREARADLGGLATDESIEASSGNGRSPLDAASIRDRVKSADDVRFEDVPVDEWGVTFRVFSTSGRERARMMEQYMDPATGELMIDQLYPQLLIATCYSPETGDHPSPEHRVFSPDDEPWLNEKSSAALEKVAQVALKLSGMDRAAKERAGKG